MNAAPLRFQKKTATSYRLSPYTIELISNAAAVCGISRTEVVEIAVKELTSKLQKGRNRHKRA